MIRMADLASCYQYTISNQRIVYLLCSRHLGCVEYAFYTIIRKILGQI